MEVAVRKPSDKTSIALWRHEFCVPYTRQMRGKAAKKDVKIYEALEFRKGSDMPGIVGQDCPRNSVPAYGFMRVVLCFLGANGVARHVCEIGGRYGVVRRENGTCSVSKVLWVVSVCTEQTNGSNSQKTVKGNVNRFVGSRILCVETRIVCSYTTKLYTEFYAVRQPD